MYRPCSTCPNKDCQNNVIRQPQCFSCQHWIGTHCTIYGLLESNRGCCEQFDKIIITSCLEAAIYTRDDGIQCTLIDVCGCKQCYETFENTTKNTGG